MRTAALKDSFDQLTLNSHPDSPLFSAFCVEHILTGNGQPSPVQKKEVVDMGW